MKKRLTPEEFVRIARAVPRDERTPYAFEKRVMARLNEAPAPDPLALWTKALWRAAVPCLALMLLSAVVSIAAVPSETHTIDLEDAVLAPAAAEFDLME